MAKMKMMAPECVSENFLQAGAMYPEIRGTESSAIGGVIANSVRGNPPTCPAVTPNQFGRLGRSRRDPVEDPKPVKLSRGICG